MKRTLISLLLITCALFSSCTTPKTPQPSPTATAPPSPIITATAAPQTHKPTPEPTPEPTPKPKPGRLASWVVYWDESDYIAELERLRPDDLSIFGAMFKKNGELYLADNTAKIHKDILASDYKPERLFLTFVNDVEVGHKRYSQKDVGILNDVFADDETVATLIDEIIALASSMAVDGVEIDFEAINTDQALWAKYLSFIERLYARCATEKLAMRVLLEPNALDRNLAFPPGPEYEIMCYNLYGAHSGAGPKATIEFIEMLIEKSQALPGEVSLALANGGYMWVDGVPISLREAEVEHYAREYNVEKIRDEASGAVCFYYTDMKGQSTAVWYADDVTMQVWIETALAHGIRSVSLWRLGDNGAAGLDSVRTAFRNE